MIINAVLTIYVNVRLSIIFLNLDKIYAMIMANTLVTFSNTFFYEKTRCNNKKPYYSQTF